MGTRLDVALVERGLVRSRAQARDLIRRGLVSVDGTVERRPARAIQEAQSLSVGGDAARRVSRGGEKLAAALAAFDLSPEGCVAVDLGASTGGFTEVLLEAGARRVYAVDVGHGQLHPAIAADPRVVTLEGTDVRDLDARLVPEPVQAIVADLSFISLTLAVGPALGLAAPGAWSIALVKPQFEAGREHVGKGGIVRDAGARAAAVEGVARFLAGNGWREVGRIVSPIEGGSGNEEWLLGAINDAV
ncbi:MAG: TlyA family rRNA (cytidine-2'-O)-methyltransferase [Rhizobiales bacterium]|nr:TlyA family rRNA (cytidine-2'-O)-methyltransferase [Hyphomicrobiales bacterium]